MTSQSNIRRWLALGIAFPGVALCVVSIARFFSLVTANGLPWNEREFFQEHYIAVGRAYSQAFMVGFFLCFFLVMIAVTIGGWAEARRSRRVASEA